jgi:hypothetical protein
MTQPHRTCLALLISLIGAGVCPALAGEADGLPPAPSVVVCAKGAPCVQSANPGEHIATTAASDPFGDTRAAVGDAALASMRGGYSVNGLNISFGIERAVYVNGALVASTSLNVSNLQRVASGGAGIAINSSAMLGLVQTGVGNSLAAGAPSAASFAAVVQNTLDGQKIQVSTVINANVSGLSMLRNLNLQWAVRSAVIDSLRR